MLGQGKAINRGWHFEDVTPKTRVRFEVHSNLFDRWSINLSTTFELKEKYIILPCVVFLTQ